MSKDTFVASSETKRKLYIAIGVGILLFILGIVFSGGGSHEAHGTHDATDHAVEAAHHSGGPSTFKRVMINLWVNNVYFIGLAVIAVFWIAVNYVAEAGWFVVMKRIPEAMGNYLPIGGLLLLILFFIGGHDIFHWYHADVYNAESDHYDYLIDGKGGYFYWPLAKGGAVPFFFILRTVAYIALWYFFYRMFRKFSTNEDQMGGVEWHKKSFKFAAGFLVIFAVTSSTSAWDWVLSIDTHWFSTMFGWYVFASWFVTGLAFITLTVVLLKENGYLPQVNTSHLHDLGKFLFGFSIFWTYIWFSQFILIWYSNIPEEVTYFTYRFENYKGLFFINLLINFVFPFLVLMTRDSKRHTIILKVVTVGLLAGHYLDFFLMTMPGTLKDKAGIGLIEVGTFVTFFSVFVLLVMNALSKAKLVPQNHPFLDESVHHHI